MFDPTAAERALELILPHPLAAVLITVGVPLLLYAIGVRFQWRRDTREEGAAVGDLMTKLSKVQGDQLARLTEEIKALSAQVELLSAGRYRLQAMVDTLREQVVTARVLLHDYERRLGLPETKFPELPIPTFTAPAPS